MLKPALSLLAFMGLVSAVEFYHPSDNGTMEIFQTHFNGTKESNATALIADATANYNIDCSRNPEVCLNVCYYAFCKNNGNNAAGAFNQKKRSYKGPYQRPPILDYPNRCSQNHDPPHEKGYDGDEYPLAGMEGGGTDDSATRCVPREQNQSAGSSFGRIDPGSDVKVALGGRIPEGSYCGRLLLQDLNCHAGNSDGKSLQM